MFLPGRQRAGAAREGARLPFSMAPSRATAMAAFVFRQALDKLSSPA